MQASLSARLAEITLPDTEGNRIQLGSLWSKSCAVVAFLRHYG
jgi:hypothetical protein